MYVAVKGKISANHIFAKGHVAFVKYYSMLSLVTIVTWRTL